MSMSTAQPATSSRLAAGAGANFDAQREGACEFLLWALEELGAKVTPDRGLYRASIATTSPDKTPKQIAFTSDRSIAVKNNDAEVVTFQCDALAATIAALGNPCHSRPRRQPENVHELTAGLFKSFQVDEGAIHLGGCSLVDRSFLRFTFADATNDDRVEHYYFDDAAQPVSSETIAELGLDDVQPFGKSLPRSAAATIDQLRRVAVGKFAPAAEVESTPLPTPILVTVIWCKYATGKIVFNIGELTAETSFSGWAKTLRPAPFQCPTSGETSFHLAATEKAITVAQQVSFCQESNRRALRQELVTCTATGAHVLPEFAINCPVSGEPIRRAAAVECKTCQQQVSPRSLTAGVCPACDGMGKISKDDPRLARLLGEYPGLDRWPRWRMSETAKVYIAQGATLWRRILVVIDRETLAPLRMATANRLSSRWTSVAEGEWDARLR